MSFVTLGLKTALSLLLHASGSHDIKERCFYTLSQSHLGYRVSQYHLGQIGEHLGLKAWGLGLTSVSRKRSYAHPC